MLSNRAVSALSIALADSTAATEIVRAIASDETAINNQTGTTYTLVLTDLGNLVTLTNSGAITVTIPPNSSVPFPLDAKVDLVELGAGVVTVQAGAGVTLLSKGSAVTLGSANGWGKLRQIAANTWLLIGSLS